MARSATSLHFRHRRNPDGSIDSICPNCFRTFACSTVESELSFLEDVHICVGFRLGWLLYPKEIERRGSLSASAQAKRTRRQPLK